MLDAAAAVALAFPLPTPVITVDNSALQTSNTVLLSASGSLASSDRSVVVYQWSVVSGSEYASFVGRTSDATAALVFVASRGTAVVELRVTDSGGSSASTRMSLNAALGPALVEKSSGGVGSLSMWWTGALLLTCAWLWLARRARLRLTPC
jgi:hypothetical protein